MELVQFGILWFLLWLYGFIPRHFHLVPFIYLFISFVCMRGGRGLFPQGVGRVLHLQEHGVRMDS